MKLISKTYCHVLMILSVIFLFSPLQAWALIISTSARADGYKDSKSDEKSTPGVPISSYVANLKYGQGYASSTATDTGVLMVSSKSEVFGCDLGNKYRASASWSDVLNNTNTSKQKYFLDLDVSQFLFKKEGFGSASYNVSVFLNSEQLWSTSNIFNESYDWSEPATELLIAPFSKSIFLGEFGTNQAFNLKYSISAMCDAIELGVSEINPFTVSGTVRTASAVPEPSSILLFGLGLGGLVFWRRRARI